MGSTDSRRQEINQLWAELQTKTTTGGTIGEISTKRLALPIGQIADFYKKRFPGQDSQITSQFGKLAAANGVTIEQAKYQLERTRSAGCFP